MSDEPIEHGVRYTFYANTPYGLVTVIECLCGEEISSKSRFWEETEREMDEHIEEATAK